MIDLFDASDFVARTQCGPGWSPALVATHRIADLLIFASYMALPFLTLWRAKRGRPFFPRNALGLFLLVGFVASCGVTHLTNQMMFVWPVYRLDALAKVVCASFSVACVLWTTYDGARR